MKVEAEAKKKSEVYEDVWIPTQCRRCHGQCSILAHRVNGVVVRLEGNPDSCVGSRGGVCARGLSGLQILYDPNRLKVPLRRTNPEKGIGVDPKWKEISWNEALDEIATRLKKVLDEDPTKILVQSGVSVMPTGGALWKLTLSQLLHTPKGAALTATGGTGSHCGNVGHLNNGINNGGWGGGGETGGCNYRLIFGSTSGFGNMTQAMNWRTMADVAQGMKVVVFDPVCSLAAAKAAEWIPIIPGTDLVVVLAMLNVIVNDLGIYDAPFLKKRTNAPYLVGPDGRYIRDRDNDNKPMIWDTTALKTKIFEDPTIGDFDLDGIHEVNGIKCRPVWQVLREQFKKYPPEKASEISGVPAATIRRIAKEFAEAAMVGANVSIEGMQIRHRPVQAGGGPERGAIAHHNGYHTGYTINLLNFVLGAYDAFGSGVMIPLDLRYQEDLPAFKLGPVKDHDGFASPRSWALPYGKFPLPDVKHPREKDLRDLFLMEMDTPIWGVSDREEVLRKAKIDPTIEVVLNYGCDSVLTYVNPRDQAKFLKKVPFVVDFELFGTEFNEGFADIVLPDQCYLEYSDWGSSIGGFFGQTSLLEEPWTFQITQRTVEPQYSRRYVMDVTMDILDRIGLRAKFNEYLNNYINLNETLKLKPTDKLTWEQLGDRVVKSYFGPEHDWEWFKKHGFITWPKTPQEFYSSSLSSDLRIPIYREFMIDLGEKIRKVVEELDMEINWQQYTAYPEWFPCPPHQVKDPQYDLYCFCYRDPLHMNAVSMEQPWLDEASSTNPFTYNITMNIDMAQQKGLKEGDTIELESDKGNKVQGVLHLREGQLPQAVAIMGSAGHWAKGQPIARGKGINFNSLMEVRWSECDPICFILECCVKVKATKIK